MSGTNDRLSSDPPVRRPAAATGLMVVLGFLGLTAIPGAIALGFGGEGVAPPGEWLDAIPVVDSWTLPAIVLGVGFGVGGLVTCYGVARRPTWHFLDGIERATGFHWSWLATLLLGLAHIVWISLEVLYLPELSVLQLVYGAVGIALSTLPLTRPVRDYLRR